MEVEYKNIDPKLIVNEIRNGRSIEAVQKLFGLRFKSEVQDLYMKGLMELGEIPPVDFGRKKAQSAGSKPSGVQGSSQPQVQAKTAQQGLAHRGQPAAPVVEYVEHRKPELSIPAEMPEREPRSERPVVIRRRERKPGVVIKTQNLRTIGQSGSITLNKSLLIDQLGFSIGDAFEIYREDDRIVLQKIDLHEVP
ncbi:AbrB/MazE/SpoVT family DNA-binding domain-containing protein [Thermodesulforhabdus norvegica]|uniref:SpoVT-AbrB domain-containing protein n=1 Tax=Thermodesulforhabdus norvegica TaxID=39841 RepID=A0A1I4SB23_9BACT|nr:AbrB/MazE/SpoVT family DNA-binding domain-containing protein [Thermodesulforhabdus norvegica]SFM61726.1 hypothetical protein SAMN05660836_00868 [Thermodesulforhabdus norvegica]